MSAAAPLAYHPPDDDQRRQQIAVSAESFGGTASEGEAYAAEAEASGLFRVVTKGGRVEAGLVALPAGHWFGGRVVPVWAIASVAVTPAARGRGVGSRLMVEALREAKLRGIALLSLSASTTTFYRRVGFEPAGDWRIWSLPREAIPRQRTGATLIPFEPGAEAAVRLLQRRCSAAAGPLERSSFFHRRAWGTADQSAGRGDEPVDRYLLLFDGEPEGYVVFNRRRNDGVLFGRDVVALTRRAAEAALSAAAATTARTFRWVGSPTDPLVYATPEVRARVHQQEDWLLRVADVEGALRQRGYPPLSAALHLDITDNVLAENHGPWLLRLEQGQPRIERGGRGTLRCDVRAFASMFTGHQTAGELAARGLVDLVSAGAQEQAALAAAIFAGPRPWMPERF